MSKQKDNDYLVNQIGTAGKNLIQVGRDYIRNIQINVTAGNWLMVVILIVPLLGISFVGFKTIESLTKVIQNSSIAQKPNLTQEKAQRIAQNWLNSVSLDNNGTKAKVISLAGVRIDDANNTAQADLNLEVKDRFRSKPLPGTAYFTRYSDGNWAMTKFVIDNGNPPFNPTWTMNATSDAPVDNELTNKAFATPTYSICNLTTDKKESEFDPRTDFQYYVANFIRQNCPSGISIVNGRGAIFGDMVKGMPSAVIWYSKINNEIRPIVYQSTPGGYNFKIIFRGELSEEQRLVANEIFTQMEQQFPTELSATNPNSLVKTAKKSTDYAVSDVCIYPEEIFLKFAEIYKFLDTKCNSGIAASSKSDLYVFIQGEAMEGLTPKTMYQAWQNPGEFNVVKYNQYGEKTGDSITDNEVSIIKEFYQRFRPQGF
jgi:hypothetical protein